MSAFSTWIPGQILYETREELKGVRGIKRLRYIVARKTGCKPGDIRDFHYKMNGHDWKGVIYLNRNSLMGSLFSLFDSKPFVVRGYPKIKYLSASRVIGREVSVGAKYDGTNIAMFPLPTGELMGKTRLMPRFDVVSLEAQKRGYDRWKDLLDRCRIEDKLNTLLKDDYGPVGELYGYLNPGQFIKYNIPVNFKVFDIVDYRSMMFLPYFKVMDLCSEVGLDYCEEIWRGNLFRKEASRLEFEAKKFFVEDGYEGFVAKWFSEEDKDVYFCKIVCEDRFSMITFGVRAAEIRKAIRKVQADFPYIEDFDAIAKLVRAELLEDYDKELVDSAGGRIKEYIRYAILPTPDELREQFRDIMNELETHGINLVKEKGEVLSTLAHRLGLQGHSGGNLLFKVYNQVLNEMGK